MSYLSRLCLFVCLPAFLFGGGCEKRQVPPGPDKHKAEVADTTGFEVSPPKVVLKHTLSGVEGRAWFEAITPAQHPLGSTVTEVSVNWWVDHERVVTESTSISFRMERDYRIVQDAKEETRAVEALVTVTYADGLTASAKASAEVPLSRSCDGIRRYDNRNWTIDCDRKNVFRLPEPVSFDTEALLAASNQFAAADWGSEEHQRFTQFVDLFLKRLSDPDSETPIDYNPDTYAYRPVTSPVGPYSGSDRVIGSGGFEPPLLIDRICIDIPLHGSACIHGYMWDVDQEPNQAVFQYAPTMATARVTGVTTGSIDIVVELWQVWYDVIYEPPHDVYDKPATEVGDRPDQDLSAYVKASGKKNGYDLRLHFRVYANAPQEWVLVSFSEPFVLSSPDYYSYPYTYSYVQPFEGLRLGPFCNSNLGTVDGLRSYPGMVSDTIDGAPSGQPITTFTSKVSYPYPHTASSEHGGSGVGRDALGVNVPPFSFGGSDNAFNCVRPADACDVPGEQDGGPDWNGVTEGCEYPNVSNDSDDATYRTSEAIVRPWIPYY